MAKKRTIQQDNIFYAVGDDEINVFEARSLDEDNNPLGYYNYLANSGESSTFNCFLPGDGTSARNYDWKYEGWEVRKATQEEKDWYTACAKAKEFVEKPISNLFPIY